MAEDQAAGVPPAAETAILALGAGAAGTGPEPTAAPGPEKCDGHKPTRLPSQQTPLLAATQQSNFFCHEAE